MLVDRDHKLRPSICQVRRIGDKHTWTIDLDITGVEVPERPDYVVEIAGFGMKVEDTPNLSQHFYKLTVHCYFSPVLIDDYAHAGMSSKHYYSLKKRLAKLYDQEIERTKPEVAHQDGDLICYRFQTPDGHKTDDWKYYDDFMPEWTNEIERRDHKYRTESEELIRMDQILLPESEEETKKDQRMRICRYYVNLRLARP